LLTFRRGDPLKAPYPIQYWVIIKDIFILQTSEMRSACEESCFTDSDCGSSGERCCPNDCGGHTCNSPQKWKKQKDATGQCVKADAFMQCLYDQLKEKVKKYCCRLGLSSAIRSCYYKF
jgi:hypothetical protein